MSLDKYLNKGGWYEDESGISYETAEDFLQCSVLKFCGCGMPDYSLQLVWAALRLVKKLREKPEGYSYENWEKECLQVFGNSKSMYFVWYVLDQKGLTEHGGSVPGWLTEKGEEMLENLDEYIESEVSNLLDEVVDKDRIHQAVLETLLMGSADIDSLTSDIGSRLFVQRKPHVHGQFVLNLDKPAFKVDRKYVRASQMALAAYVRTLYAEDEAEAKKIYDDHHDFLNEILPHWPPIK